MLHTWNLHYIKVLLYNIQEEGHKPTMDKINLLIAKIFIKLSTLKLQETNITDMKDYFQHPCLSQSLLTFKNELNNQTL